MNKVVHFEIPYEDKDRATSFYKTVFGWGIEDMPEMNYTIARSVETDENHIPKESGAINGGFYKRKEGVATGPVLVIDVPSIDEHIKKVEEAGGSSVMPKVKVGDMGLYAQVKDTEGNIIGIWESVKKD